VKQYFVGLSTEIIADRFAFIGTSAGRELCANEISSQQALGFLYSLHTLKQAFRKADYDVKFVWYAATRDVEMMARDLPALTKDRLFPSQEMLHTRREISLEIEEAQIQMTRAERKGRESRAAEWQVRLKECRENLRHTEYAFVPPYRIQYHAGKTFTIGRQDVCGKVRNTVTVYDLFSFFRCTLQKAVRDHLGVEWNLPDRESLNIPLWEAAITDALITQNKRECESIAALAECLRGYFADAGIYLNQWYGPSAAANYCLAKWEARKEFRPVNNATAPRIFVRAVDRAFYGGRLENLKLGTVGPVYVQDINAAYAYAICLLSQATGRWSYRREYTGEPFSVWLVEYDLESVTDNYIGPFPHRSVTGGISFRKSGRGWYWQPEVDEALKRWPDKVRVRYGYAHDYEPISFAPYIETLYERRRELKAAGAKSELALKLLLVSLYGKFAQQIGEAPYCFKPWAGWITSYVRAMLLRAVAGNERNVICFMQDAVHSTVPLDLPVSDKIGEWKVTEYESGLYLSAGIYKLSGPGRVRRAMRGYETIDFDKAANEMSARTVFTAERQFFVGWRLAQEFKLRYERSYLQRMREPFESRPTETKARFFPHTRGLWSNEFFDSLLVQRDDGRESAVRRDERFLLKQFDMMIDVIKAGRYEK